MTDQTHYTVLSIEPSASREEVETAFQEALTARRARRAKTSDLHAAYAVLSDPTLRRAYDLQRFGEAAGDKLATVKDAAIEALPDIDWSEVRQQAWQTSLKATVLVSGATAKAADAAARLSRRVQREAAKRIETES